MERSSSRLVVPLLALTAALLGTYALQAHEAPTQAEAPVSRPAPAAAPTTTTTAAAGAVVELTSEDLALKVSEDSAALLHVVLRDERYRRDGQQIDLITTDKPAYLPLRLTLDGAALEFAGAHTLSRGAARFTAQRGDLEIARKLELAGGPFQLWSTVQITNRGTAPAEVQLAIEAHHYVRRDEEQSGLFAGRSQFLAATMCLTDDGPQRLDREDSVEGSEQGKKPVVQQGGVRFGSIDNVYFTQAIAAEGEPFATCAVSGSDRPSAEQPHGSLLTVQLSYANKTIAPGQSETFRTVAYLGPKSQDLLEEAGHDLALATYSGGFWGIDSIARGLAAMLKIIQSKVGNWGLSIILLTLLVKLVLYPLTAKSFQSMAAMRKLKPEIDALNEKYANDREKKGAAMWELYRKHKISPFGGCLPQLLQLPIWWGLYTSLSTNVDLFHRGFALWSDLTAADPYYMLPLALGALMFVQQKLTPTAMDPMQAKMMLYMMPTMITAFMLFLPAGLCLYMFTNSLLSIAQQKYIERRLDKGGPPAGKTSLSGSPA